MSGEDIENVECCQSAESNRVSELRCSLKHAYQKIEQLEKDVFRYKMLGAGKDEMMNSLGWSVKKPEEMYKGDA
jgi:hypothetical protein